jgi:carbamoyl-phosphate synthase large subunit
MAIGRSFTEAVQKACQSLENNAVGLGYYGKSQMHAEELLEYIKIPKWDRIFRLKDAIMLGISINTIAKATGIDRWFLYEIQKICNIEKELTNYYLEDIPLELMKQAKIHGFSDEQIARIIKDGTEDEIYEKRKAAGITRVYKMVDTCSAEFEAKTPYFYSTFEDGQANESVVTDRKKIIVLGSGPNRIGQGIEFDYCCVHGLLAIKEAGYESIMVNLI